MSRAPACGHRPPFRREATITARAAHRTGAVIFAPDAPPPRPPLQRRFQVGPVRHASPEPPAVRGRLRRFLRRSQSLNSQNHPLARPPIVIDNYHYASHHPRPTRPRSPDAPTRQGRWPSPRRPPAGSPTPRSASTPDGPTPARCGAWDAWRGAAPLTDVSLAVYLGALFEAGRAPATAALAVAAVRCRATLAGQPAPAGAATARVLGGYRRTAADRGRGQAAPLRADGLAAILATAARPRTDGRGVESPTTAHRRGRLDAVIASLLFMGGLRRSEVSALEWRDVSDARDGDGVLLTVRTSKTNHEGDAADVRYLKNGAANAIRTLRAADADAAPTDRVVGLSPLQIQRRFTAAARAAGIEARLTAHSGRVGLASELTARGASTTEVMLAGNWKTARMVAHYSAGATAERGAVRKYL